MHEPTSSLEKLLQSLPPYTRRVLVLGAVDERAAAMAGVRGFELYSTETAASDAMPQLVDAIAATAHDAISREALEHLGPFGRIHGAVALSARRGLRIYGADGVWVRDNYDPVAHGASLLEQGHPRWAIELLEAIPPDFITESERRLVVCLHLQLAYLLFAEAIHGPDRLRAFFRAQQQFYSAAYIFPYLPQPYEVQAAFWGLIGDPGMGGRLHRSMVTAMGETDPRPPPTTPEAATMPTTPEPPPWDPGFRPRVLIVGHRHSDYGMDVLYDGLVHHLGADRVTEFPYKPFLHGCDRDAVGSYPCAFNHPGVPRGVEELCRELREGRFDIVLYADIRRDTPRDEVLRLLDAAQDAPLFIVDTWDDGSDLRDVLLDHIQRDCVRAYFKREMLRCWDYGPDTYPLPFAYPDALVATERLPMPRDGVFWAGHRHFGLRRLYLEVVEHGLAIDLDQTLDPAEYQRSLQQARVALDCFGFGYDTVRYWEIPAHGATLLAEKKPIHIPFDFVHNESCVHFQTVEDLMREVRYALDHPEEADAIAQRGWEHLKEHHTSSKRAQHLLAWIQQLI